MFKESRTSIHPFTTYSVDTGYQGIAKIHNKVEIPKKKSKKNPLTRKDKKNNAHISSQRVTIENSIRELKIFRILAEKYRNRRRKYGLRFNLIAAIYNLNLNAK